MKSRQLGKELRMSKLCRSQKSWAMASQGLYFESYCGVVAPPKAPHKLSVVKTY